MHENAQTPDRRLHRRAEIGVTGLAAIGEAPAEEDNATFHLARDIWLPPWENLYQGCRRCFQLSVDAPPRKHEGPAIEEAHNADRPNCSEHTRPDGTL
jgi:hypothetical protein